MKLDKRACRHAANVPLHISLNAGVLYTERVKYLVTAAVKLLATQDLNDFFSLEDGKYGRGILNNCKIKIILNLEEEEAQRVQSVLKLTDAEIDNITRFERGSALIVTNSNNVTVDMRCSEEEKDLITTDRDELRRIVERKMQNQTETEES